MAHEFDELILDGHNYPTWVLDVKIRLAFCGIMAALTPPVEREAAFLDTYKYQTLHHPEPPPPQLKVRICDVGGAS
jgi:hypothetical protein